MPHLLVLGLAPLFPIADRLIGRGHQGDKTIGVLLVLAGSVAIAWLSGLWPLAIMALAWVITRRVLPFNSPFGRTTPRGAGEIAETLVRWSFPALAAMGLGRLGLWDASWFGLAAWMAAFAIAATLLALRYAQIKAAHERAGTPEDGENAWIEPLRGLLFAAALAGWTLT